jgi:hypothetical protein
MSKAAEAKAKAAAKKKAKGKKGKGKKGSDDDYEEDSEDDAYTKISKSLWNGAGSSKPPNGSFEKCAECGKQFTVVRIFVSYSFLLSTEADEKNHNRPNTRSPPPTMTASSATPAPKKPVIRSRKSPPRNASPPRTSAK